ncbi:MAG: OmpA family protein [Fibromonadales bacterium]|nr:OmpA family protein [Fibromonadales bacterium]
MKKLLLPLLVLLSATLASAAVSVNRDERGIIVSMNGDIFFEFNKATLSTSNKPKLIELANILIEHEELDALIEGHSDSIGTRAVNLRISTARALNVMSFLIEHGVPKDHLDAIGVAFDKPVASNATAEGRAKNRRVELIIKEHPNSDVLMEKLTQAAETMKAEPKFTELTPPPDTVQTTLIVVPETQSDSSLSCFFFMFRPEFLLVSGEISTVGLNLELGKIYNNGFVASIDFGVGGHYIGGWLNLGYEIKSEYMKNTVGISGGYHHTDLKYKIENEKGKLLRTEWGENRAFGGVFWKLRVGKNSNIDLVNKVVFGHKSDVARYDRNHYEIYKEDGVGVVWSIGLGYTFTGRMK